MFKYPVAGNDCISLYIYNKIAFQKYVDGGNRELLTGSDPGMEKYLKY